MTIIYHLIQKADWESARGKSEYRPTSLREEGFIHCSQDQGQMLAVANRLFSGRNDMLVLDVETGRVTSPIKHEHGRSGGSYPHIYGPLNMDAVRHTRTLLKDAEGRFWAVGD